MLLSLHGWLTGGGEGERKGRSKGEVREIGRGKEGKVEGEGGGKIGEGLKKGGRKGLHSLKNFAVFFCNILVRIKAKYF